MNEGAPKLHTPEAANSNEASQSHEALRKKYEAMTREQAMEEIIEPSIERAIAVQSEIQDLLKTQREEAKFSEADENVVVIHDRDAWNEYKDLLDQRRQHLIFIPNDLCFKNNLPLDPPQLENKNENDKKIQYATTSFPDTPEGSGYADKLDYTHADSGKDYPRVDQRQIKITSN